MNEITRAEWEKLPIWTSNTGTVDAHVGKFRMPRTEESAFDVLLERGLPDGDMALHLSKVKVIDG